MKKGTRIVKRVLALFLVVLMSINSFGAVVSDNDGSAFITKAEFDSLKNDFQSQIDQYNTSIDSKIDGAIASYLAGIKIEKKTQIDPLVSNYKDIMWKNDLYVKIRTRTWTATNAYTDSDLKWQKPVFAKYRFLRAGRYYMSPMYYVDTRPYFFCMYFSNNDNTYWMNNPGWLCVEAGAVDVAYHQHAIAPLVFRCYDKKNGKPIVRDTVDIFAHELQMTDRAYPCIINGPGAFSTMWDHWVGGGIGPGATGGLILKPNQAGDILRFDFRWTKYSGDNNAPVAGTTMYTDGPFYIIKKQNGYGEPQIEDFYTVDVNKLRNEVFTFCEPRYQTKWESNDQQLFDIAQINNMFLATDTDTQVNCATELVNQGPSVYRNWDYADSELKTATFSASGAMVSYNSRNWVQEAFGFIDDAGTTINASLDLPIWPQYYLRDLYTKRFKANNQELQLGGGIPILSNSLSNGNLKIKMLYTVYNADKASHGTPSQHLHISFKKSSFNDGVTNNYCKDDGGVELKDKLWEPATTLAIPSYEVTIPVKVGDDVWLRLGPKDTNANGLYAKIDNLDVTLVTE